MYKYVLKRVIDFAIALIALICISPLLLVVTVWLHFANKGAGAFFLQERPGLHGKVFKIVKFKTMNEEKGSDGKLLPDIQRITPIGSFVRKTSLDELPQLINVLKGDMALIGPRPLLVKYLSLYSAEQMRRHNVRPGISGWAQCHVSFKTDLEVIFTTIKNVLMRKDIDNNVNNGSGKFTQEEFNGSN